MDKHMTGVEIQEEDAGPQGFKHTSTVYVWHDEGMSWALHFATSGISKEDLRLGTITRVAYHTLETVDSLPNENGFLMLHTLPDSNNLDITMLPVGDDEARENINEGLRDGSGFGKVLSHVVDLCRGSERADCVRILFNTPKDLDDASKIAIVHEINGVVDKTHIDAFLSMSTGQCE
jgi:hypothetical protein